MAIASLSHMCRITAQKLSHQLYHSFQKNPQEIPANQKMKEL
jgi:hypothetical protein